MDDRPAALGAGVHRALCLGIKSGRQPIVPDPQAGVEHHTPANTGQLTCCGSRWGRAPRRLEASRASSVRAGLESLRRLNTERNSPFGKPLHPPDWPRLVTRRRSMSKLAMISSVPGAWWCCMILQVQPPGKEHPESSRTSMPTSILEVAADPSRQQVGWAAINEGAHRKQCCRRHSAASVTAGLFALPLVSWSPGAGGRLQASGLVDTHRSAS